MNSPIFRALMRQTPAERLAVGVWRHPCPGISMQYALLMLAIALKLEFGVAPGQRGGE